LISLEEQIKLIADIKRRLNENSARLFSLSISGSHLYGFSSEDSDIDIRGIFVTNTNRLLGLSKPKTTMRMEIGKYDIELHELNFVLNKALKGNFTILEHIFVDQIYTTKEFLKMRKLIPLTKNGLRDSYRGMSMHNYKKFIRTGKRNEVKKYLYVLRGLLAGIYVLDVGQLKPNIDELVKHFKFPIVKTLVELKKRGKERNPIPGNLDTGVIENLIETLLKRIDRAYMKSSLSEEPTKEERERVEELLLDIRRKNLDT